MLLKIPSGETEGAQPVGADVVPRAQGVGSRTHLPARCKIGRAFLHPTRHSWPQIQLSRRRLGRGDRDQPTYYLSHLGCYHQMPQTGVGVLINNTFVYSRCGGRVQHGGALVTSQDGPPADSHRARPGSWASILWPHATLSTSRLSKAPPPHTTTWGGGGRIST